ncbi:MAG TPA: OmpA family protein, partial [Burkholderiales bacterium]|nr:OmpA family protein [Burkholderiales bacterium]
APVPAPAPAPKPAPKPEAAKPKPVAEKVTYAADVLFDFDRAVLRPEGKSKLDDLSAKIKDINLEVVIAVGHADRIGPAPYNQRLSLRRAEAIKAYLVSKGVEPNRVYTEGKGQTQPVTGDKCKGPRGAALIKCLQPDRRTEIEVIGTRRM